MASLKLLTGVFTAGYLALACGQQGATPFSGTRATETVKQWTLVRVPLTELTPQFMQETGFNRDHKKDPNFAFGYIETKRFDRLNGSLRTNLAPIEARAWSQGRVNPRSLEVIDQVMDDPIGAQAEGYHTFESLTQELQSIAQRYPNLVKLESAGKSVQGRDLWYVRLSDNISIDSHRPKLIYSSTMHGDEVTGVEMMVYLIRKLTTGFGTDARVTKLLSSAHLYIMPLMNPDGNALRQRFNANGVDLNRDFPDFTSDPTDSLAGRAIETQALMKLHDNNHFLLSLNFHGGELCFNLPWDTKQNGSLTEKFGDDKLMSFLGREYTQSNQPMYQNSDSTFDRGLTYGYEWYEVDGGMQDWSNFYRRANHATVELSSVKWPNAAELPGFWRDNEEALTRFLERGTEGVHIRVTGAQGRGVAAPAIGVSTASRDIIQDSAYIHRPTVPGTQTVTLKATGFQSLNFQLNSETFSGTFENAVLQPTVP